MTMRTEGEWIQAAAARLRRRRRRGPLAAVVAFAALFLAGCGGVQVYNFGGEGRGQSFHVPAEAAMNESAVVQSWIAYSLSRSACKLEMGGALPSANTSFECELRPRRVLARRWAERIDSPDTDAYLDQVAAVEQQGLLAEYVWHYFGRRDWERPSGLDMERFETFRRAELGWHRPRTRLIGYWTQNGPGGAVAGDSAVRIRAARAGASHDTDADRPSRGHETGR